MTRLALVLFTGIGLLVTGLARADCAYPKEITVPDGNTATEAEMKAAFADIKKYNADVESYLACMDEDEKKLGDTVTDEQKKLHVERHNAAVDALNAVAARYNEQVQIFKKRAQ